MPTDRINPFAPTGEDELAAGYAKAASTRPYTKADIAKALKPYKLGAASKRRGKTDVQLETIAANAVVAKFKASQKKPAPTKKVAPAKAPARAVATRTTSVPAPKLLTSSQILSRLKALGAPTTWKPPSYALTSQAKLDAWIKAALAYAAQHRTPAMPKPVSSPVRQATTNTTTRQIATNRAPIPL